MTKSFAWVAAILGSALSVCSAQDADSESLVVLERDLAIIGGGSSGSYSAISAKQDYGLSVVVIEKESHLGGHVTFYTDPTTGRTFECGVQNFLNITGAQRHFDRLGIPMQANVRNVNTQRYVDFTDGKEINFTLPSTADRAVAFQTYVDLTTKWQQRMEPGYHNFFSAAEIPKDLLMPFSQFVDKYNLTAALMQFYYLTGFSHATYLSKPTLGFVRALPPDMMRAFLTGQGGVTSLVPVSKRNQDIYDASQRLIGDDNILFDSTVESSTLPCDDESAANGAKAVLMVRNAKTGKLTKVIAKHVLFSASPTAQNVAPLALKPQIENLFTKMWNFPSEAYVAVVSHPALPPNTALINTPARASPRNYALAMPDTPFQSRFEQYPDSRFYRAIAAGDGTMTLEGAKEKIQSTLERMIAVGTIKYDGPAQNVTYHQIKSHGVTNTTPSSRHIKCGFYDRLMANNGKCGVWYTGGNFGVALSTHIWLECEATLKKIKASLG